MQELQAIEIEPFRKVLAASRVDAVMTAHVVYPALDERFPATLSYDILQLLRTDLDFDGLIITDSLTMEAIVDTWTVGEAAVLAVESGADIISLKSASDVHEVFSSLIEAVRSGRLAEDRVDESVERVLELKRRIGVGAAWSGDPVGVGSRQNLDVAASIFASARRAGCTSS